MFDKNRTKIAISLTLLIVFFISILIIISNNNDIKTTVSYRYNSINDYKDDSDMFVVDILDIGKADCIIIQDNGSVVVIDTGEDENYQIISNFLNSQNIKVIDYLIITHYDKDHVGGAAKIINEYEVINVIQPNYKKDSKHVDNYNYALNDNNIEPLTLTNELKLSLPTYQLILQPSKIVYEDDNNNSIIAIVQHDDRNLLFMGDAQSERISEFLVDNMMTFEFAKMPHHGNYNEMTEELLKQTKVKKVAITCSKKNPADRKTIELLNSYNIDTYQSVNGNIIIK